MKKTMKLYALFCGNRLLNDNGYYCKLKDQPAVALRKSAFYMPDVKENGWDIVELEVTYNL